tara:strand:+ start:295 stop:543 length:249 start_codon:yes stop_codon:yes gene_type:complete
VDFACQHRQKTNKAHGQGSGTTFALRCLALGLFGLRWEEGGGMGEVCGMNKQNKVADVAWKKGEKEKKPPVFRCDFLDSMLN